MRHPILYLSVITSLLGTASPGQFSKPDFSPVETYLAESVTGGRIAGGVLLVIHRGEVAFERGFGFADIESGRRFEIDTPVVIASISKPMLGTAIFRLAEAGELDVSAPASEYLPELVGLELESGEVAERAPSLAELLSHTAGLRSDSAPRGRPWFASWTKGKPLSEVVARCIRDQPLKAQPGTRYAYSGIGTDIAARVGELVAGKPRNALLLDELCTPLGMKHTYYWDSERVKTSKLMPTRYVLDEKSGELVPAKHRPYTAPGAYSASGGTIISTAPDMARWLLMLRNRGAHASESYLAPETVGQMLDKMKVGYNAQGGFFVRKRNTDGEAALISHTGSSGTNCWVDFATDTIGIMLTQTTGETIKPFRIELQKRVTAAAMAAAPASP